MTLRPNIVYLHSHDTGRHIQPYGHQVPTPNIQRLADQGLLFRQAFSAAPVCSGSRAALLTGEYSHTNGMLGLAHRGYRLADYDHHLVHTLRDAGYTSTLIGEQHVSADPLDIGYDHVIELRSHQASEVAPAAAQAIRETDGAVVPERRLLRDPPGLLRADLGARRALFAAAREPARTRRSRAATWRPTRPARERSTRASGRCSTRSRTRTRS